MTSKVFERRDFLKVAGAGATLSALGACATGPSEPPKPVGRVVIVGGGWGGATAAKYLRMWSGGAIQVFMIERETSFISCPLSNLVLAGTRKIEDLTMSYAKLRDYGVQVVRANVTGINIERKRVHTDRIEDMPYDRLIVAPGVDFMFDQV
ncbi:MAG: FAD-dependent oxidoreductase, partial [Burkholderiales bacterium]